MQIDGRTSVTHHIGPARQRRSGNTSLATLIGRTARKVLLQMSARKRAGELLRRALSALKSFEVSSGDVSFKPE
jgi:hypothetical protein